ncbi:MAG TPA: histidinol dehydrogenase [Limnochordia bacterium]|nr:histidinol dehydrogenase [Limnochordia bacterium]
MRGPNASVNGPLNGPLLRRIDAARTAPGEISRLLRRPPLDELPEPPEVRERTRALFGEPLSAQQVVERIARDVRARGDAALIEYTRLLDGAELTPEQLWVSEAEFAAALAQADPAVLGALERAAANIAAFHERQRRESWFMPTAGGGTLGVRVQPLNRVACYVPAGRAPLVSTVLMSAVPARVAGVREIVGASPPGPDGRIDAHMLVAFRLAGASRVLKSGGAQAIMALAYGTESVAPVEKIVGPGNPFVVLAKRYVLGRVGIESLPGPSEIAILSDGSTDPAWAAADLLSQAEHSPDAGAIAITTDPAWAEALEAALAAQLAELPRAEIARAALAAGGRLVLCPDLETAIGWLNEVAAEHVELLVADPWPVLHRVEGAGAVFLGPYSTEPVGDYVAGPSHVLPTNRTARFSSPLSVDDFVRRSSVIAYTAATLAEYGPDACRIARHEGLEGHARAVEQRLRNRPAQS